MKREMLFLLCIVTTLLFSAPAFAQQTVLDFDNLTGFAPMPAGYGGIADWGSYAHSDLPDPNYPPASGNTYILSVGLPKPILIGAELIFDGASFAGQQLPFQKVWFELYHKSALVHTSAKITATLPHTWLNSGYGGLVDEVRIEYDGVNVFCVDDFTYTIPGPVALVTDVNTIKESTGGVVNFSLDAGTGNANRDYLILGSVTGTMPGIPLPGGTVTLPLNWDLFTGIIVDFLNTPKFNNFIGNLDANGQAKAKLDTMGSAPAGSAGLTLYFAYAVAKPYDFVSNAVEIKIVP